MIKNVLEYLENSARISPDKVAVADDKQQFTYKELLELSVNIGAALKDKAAPLTGVPVFIEKSCVTLSLFMGIVQAGGFYVALDPSQPSDRISLILDTIGSDVVIVSEKNLKKFEKVGFAGEVIVAEELLQSEATQEDREKLALIREAALDIDPLYSIFTSGSTGVPKGVIVNHRSVIDFIEVFTEKMSITSEDVIGNQAPFDFDVSVKDIYSSLKMGATMQIIPKSYFSFPTRLLDYLDDRKVTTLIWAVSALGIVCNLNGFGYKIPAHINKVIFSGEVMPVKMLNIWRNAYPDATFVNVYGPTEITCNCTYYIVDREYSDDEVLPLGKPFPNERVFLLDENNKLVSSDMANVSGEICVSGTAVTLGYFNNREKTGEVFVQNPLNDRFNEIIYRTGDLGYYNDKGELFYSSRKDFQIKFQGHRIELTEVELAINAVQGVDRVCVIFDHDNNRLIAFYSGNLEKKAIVSSLTKKIPKFMIPTDFMQVETMPLTKNGKIDRKQLMEMFEASKQV